MLHESAIGTHQDDGAGVIHQIILSAAASGLGVIGAVGLGHCSNLFRCSGEANEPRSEVTDVIGQYLLGVLHPALRLLMASRWLLYLFL